MPALKRELVTYNPSARILPYDHETTVVFPVNKVSSISIDFIISLSFTMRLYLSRLKASSYQFNQ